MNIFSTLMPGVRQLRTPLSVGAIWFLCVYLALSPNWADLASKYEVLQAGYRHLTALPLIYVVGALAFAAYIFGSVAQGLSSIFALLIKGLVNWVERKIEANRRPLVAPWRRLAARRRDAFPVRTVVMDAVSEKYSDAGLAPGAYLSFPFQTIEAQLEAMSLQLWKKAPDQYQESDRLKAESAFRVGVSLPIVVLGIQLGSAIVWLAAVPFAVSALILVLQSRTLEQERRGLLANALYQGLIVNTTLNSTVRNLLDLKLPQKLSIPEWYAATAVALNRAGDVDASGSVAAEGAFELSDAIDFEKDDWKSQVDRVMDLVRPIFESNGDDEHWSYFERQVASAQSRAESALRDFGERSNLGEDRPDWAARRAWQGRA